MAQDGEFQSRTKSALGWLPTEKAGLIRNLGIAIANQAKLMGDETSAKLVCTGISERAENVIKDAIENGQVLGIRKVGTIERERHGFPHTAVLIELDDGSQHIIDWWKTLEPGDPALGKPSDAEWSQNAIRWLYEAPQPVSSPTPGPAAE